MLCLWLPFTDGTTENYGLTNMDVIDYETSVYNQGKLGKCRSFVGNGYLQLSNAFGIESGKDFSCCYWIKEISNNTLSQFRVVYQCGNLIIGHYGNKFNIYSNSNALDLTYNCDTTEWVHCCMTYQCSDNTVAIYINGVKCSTSQPKNLTGLSNTTAFIGKRSSDTYLFEGYLNDFRIYNTCLSPRQVKEISKGLVCHYPLGEIDGKISGRNLIKNGKGNVKAGFFKNFPTVTDEYAEFTLKSKKTYPSINLNDGFVYGCREYDVGEKYTWSYDIMYTVWNFPTGSNRAEFWMGQRYTIAPSGETATGTWSKVTQHNLPVIGQNGCKLNKWYHVKQTVTIPDPASSNVKQQAIIAFYNSNADVEASFTARIKNVKLEKSSTTTPWTPAPEDDASFYDNIIYDTSGYCNNGSVTDSTCPTWSSDTPRYKGSYVFNGSNQYFTFHNPISSAFDEFSISCWVKFDDTTGNSTICTMRTVIGNGIALFKVGNKIRFDDNAQFTFSDYTISANEWTHVVVTRASSAKKLYINGELKQLTSTVGDMANVYDIGSIGASSASGNGFWNYTKGNISDFRIYATALDNQTIEELYKVGALVDNNGNLMLAGEVIEE